MDAMKEETGGEHWEVTPLLRSLADEGKGFASL